MENTWRVVCCTNEMREVCQRSGGHAQNTKRTFQLREWSRCRCGLLIDGITAFDGALNVGVMEFQTMLVPCLRMHIWLCTHAPLPQWRRLAANSCRWQSSSCLPFVEYFLKLQQFTQLQRPAPVVDISLAPAVSYSAPAFDLENMSPGPALCAPRAPVMDCVSPAPAVSCSAPPVHTQLQPLTGQRR